MKTITFDFVTIPCYILAYKDYIIMLTFIMMSKINHSNKSYENSATTLQYLTMKSLKKK